MSLDSLSRDQLVEAVRRFVRERLVPQERAIAEADSIPEGIVDEMRGLGLFGLTTPPEFGGLGLGLVDEMHIAFELGRTSPAFRSLFGTNIGIGSLGILIDGTEAQKQAYLPRLASGEIIGSFCLTEPESGSDAASLTTRARREGESYLLNGTKRFITNAPRAGLFTVMARTQPAEAGTAGISAFLVEAGLPGITVGPAYRKMGQQGTQVADVVFTDCRVPATALLGGVEGRGFKTAMKVLDRGRLHISAVCVGAAERLIADSLRYAMERRQFGEPIGEFQLIQAMLADSKTEAYAARCMVLDAATRADQGESIATLAACCKLFASEMVGRVADRAVQIHGGAGYVADYAVERFYRDVRLFRIYEGTSQIQQIIIARSMLREAAAAM
ncbi:MAG TPA: acyl-CoA dehydrogenase family protein [Verrucomicrobiae bacterium]|nr:acyl-CoA dehydrogenase family protein [Verrucomicrobiae bacterium]